MGRDSSDNKPGNTTFKQAMEGTVEIHQDRVEPWKRRHRHHQQERHQLQAEPDESCWQEHFSENEIKTEDELKFYRPGIQQRLFRDLRRGRIRSELELDLHGFTANHARQTLEQFLGDCRQRKLRCARIIHGKGYGSKGQQPVLKQKLNIWLRQHRDVLAFCSATPQDGGTGAVYVLLRSPHK
jgi:DNA-nicking Smr family endonuclease